jgi:hypothetical protein
MASYTVLPENTPFQNLKKYVVYVGEDSIQDTYWSGSSNKPRIFVTVTATASVVTQWLSTMLHRHRQNLSAHNHVVGLGVQWSNPDNNPNLSTAILYNYASIMNALSSNSLTPISYRKISENFSDILIILSSDS